MKLTYQQVKDALAAGYISPLNSDKRRKKKVVSFSGGRTSAYLCYLMKEKYGDDVDFVYMDTGAEHPKTYEFIRNVNEHFKLNLTCLRAVFNPTLGKGNSYEILDINDICCDLNPWREMMKKYGTPYLYGAFCTDRMKLRPCDKYLHEKYGKKGWVTYLGIRADEPRRLTPKEGIVYLAELSDFDKDDIIDFWSGMPFDLEIEEHLGNCVFCIKKGVNKIALASRDEPVLFEEFNKALKSESVRVVERRKSPSLEMYRNRSTLDGVIQMFSDHSRDDIYNTMRKRKMESSGSCSESCEVFSCSIGNQGSLLED